MNYELYDHQKKGYKDVIHDCIYDFDEDLNLISVTRTYYTSYEAMKAAHDKFKLEHPDIWERREKGMAKMWKEAGDYVRAVRPSEESST